MWFKNANILIYGIDVLGGVAVFWNDLLMMINYSILVEWWNDDEEFDWILDDCQNNYEMSIEFFMNVETMMKMLMF